MATSFKLGMIGGGLDSAVGLTHKIASQMDGCWELVAGCFSTKDDVNISTASKWGVSADRCYKTWQNLLRVESGELDAVLIVTPTPTHKEMVCEALKAGYNVICEKALAGSLNEVQEIKKTLIDHNGFLAVTYNYTGYPMLRELKAKIQNGFLGNIIQIHVEMPQEGFLRLNTDGKKPTPQTWRLRDRKVPTIYLDLGVHVHQLIHFLIMQNPIELVAMHEQSGFFPEIKDNTMCLARYSGGVSCSIWFSKCTLGHRNGLRVRVYGDKASAEWVHTEPETLTWANQKGSCWTTDRSSPDNIEAHLGRYERFKVGHPAGFVEAFANHYADLASSLKEYRANNTFNSPWVFSIDIAEEGLRMLEAMVTSANNHKWVKV